MTAPHRKPQKKHSVEVAMIRLTLLTGLIFSAWITYHFVKPALEAFILTFP